MIWCAVVWHLIFHVCFCVGGVCVCVHVRLIVCLYIRVLAQIQREGVCEISCKWKLDVAENCHLKTPTSPKISILIHISISNSSNSSSSTAL